MIQECERRRGGKKGKDRGERIKERERDGERN